MRRKHISCAVMLLLAGMAGCARTNEGMKILESLRADGLLEEGVDEPMASAAVQANDAIEALPADGPLSLTMLLDAADRLNPRITAARAEIGIAGGETWQASLYPNPSVEIRSENVRPAGNGFGGSETTLSVAQPIVISNRREAAVAAGQARMSAKRWDVERVRRDVRGAVRREVTEMAYATQAIELYSHLQELAQRTLDIASARFEARAAPESEAIRAGVELSRLEIAVQRLRGDQAAANERLNALLGGQHVDANRIGHDALETSTKTSLPALNELKVLVRATHPALMAAASSIEEAERQVELERAKGTPDITARLGVGISHADDEAFVEGGFGLPIPIFDQNQGQVLAARFALLRVRAEADASANELLGRLGEAYRQWESAVARRAAYRDKILAGAQRSYDQTMTAYQGGAMQFLDVLDAQRTLTEANVAHVELTRSVSLALTEILEILGEQPVPNNTTGEQP